MKAIVHIEIAYFSSYVRSWHLNHVKKSAISRCSIHADMFYIKLISLLLPTLRPRKKWSTDLISAHGWDYMQIEIWNHWVPGTQAVEQLWLTLFRHLIYFELLC